jgi:farnesyl-diphosphate farnesyltransferase
LQLVNILRDLSWDLRGGRCYVPLDRLAAFGLSPADLRKPSHEPQFRGIYEFYLDIAMAHLAAGWNYTNALPFGQVRLRLACAWPLLIGAATLQKLRGNPILDPERRVKISRRELRSVLFPSLIWYPWRKKWVCLFPEPNPECPRNVEAGMTVEKTRAALHS